MIRLTDINVLDWDWKDFPKAAQINITMQRIYNGHSLPFICEVPNPPKKRCVWIVSPTPITPRTAQRLYDELQIEVDDA